MRSSPTWCMHVCLFTIAAGVEQGRGTVKQGTRRAEPPETRVILAPRPRCAVVLDRHVQKSAGTNPNPNPNPITLTLARPARRAADQCGPRKDGPRLAQGGLRVIARVRVRVRLELGLGLGLGLAWLGLGRTRTLSLSPPRSGQRRGDEGLMVEHTRDCARPRDGCLSARPVRRGKQIKYYVK